MSIHGAPIVCQCLARILHAHGVVFVELVIGAQRGEQHLRVRGGSEGVVQFEQPNGLQRLGELAFLNIIHQPIIKVAEYVQLAATVVEAQLIDEVGVG